MSEIDLERIKSDLGRAWQLYLKDDNSTALGETILATNKLVGYLQSSATTAKEVET